MQFLSVSQRWSQSCWLFTHSWLFRSSLFFNKLAASFCPFYSIVCTSVFLLVACLQVWKYLDSAVWVLFTLTLEEHHVLARSQMLLYCRCCHWFPLVSVTTFSLLIAEFIGLPNGALAHIQQAVVCIKQNFDGSLFELLLCWFFRNHVFLFLVFIFVLNWRVCDQRKK